MTDPVAAVEPGARLRFEDLRGAIDALAAEMATAWPSALESGNIEVLDRVVTASRALRDVAMLLGATGRIGSSSPR